MEWQPIETAPKTNHAILIWVPEIECTFCVTWRESIYDYPDGWAIFGGYLRQDQNLQSATHWMPLPPPPQVQS
jgi:hypothetical protein